MNEINISKATERRIDLTVDIEYGTSNEKIDRAYQILKEIAAGLITQLLNMNIEESESLNDLNTLFAIVCALAVLQDALPGYIRTSKPLKLVLDKRPFL